MERKRPDLGLSRKVCAPCVDGAAAIARHATLNPLVNLAYITLAAEIA
jgi:hypothetical protein